jgi:bacillolysin
MHYGNSINNAYWVGNSGNYYMLYGDGSSLPPLTALDICAHEFGHGINEFSANTAGEQVATMKEMR